MRHLHVALFLPRSFRVRGKDPQRKGFQHVSSSLWFPRRYQLPAPALERFLGMLSSHPQTKSKGMTVKCHQPAASCRKRS